MPGPGSAYSLDRMLEERKKESLCLPTSHALSIVSKVSVSLLRNLESVFESRSSCSSKKKEMLGWLNNTKTSICLFLKKGIATIFCFREYLKRKGIRLRYVNFFQSLRFASAKFSFLKKKFIVYKQ